LDVPFERVRLIGPGYEPHARSVRFVGQPYDFRAFAPDQAGRGAKRARRWSSLRRSGWSCRRSNSSRRRHRQCKSNPAKKVSYAELVGGKQFNVKSPAR
jgi:hypothetical protein